MTIHLNMLIAGYKLRNKNMERKVKKYPNGLTLVYQKDTTQKSVFFEFRFLGGISNDPEDKLGLSHFVEHIVACGNKKYTQKEKTNYNKKLFYSNFATSFDYISFYAHISDEEVEDTFAHFVNYLTDIDLKDEEFEIEKQVIKQEIALKQKKTKKKEMSNIVSETLYNRKVSCRISAAGLNECVDKITKEDVINWFKQCFVLDKCQITIYGNISYCNAKQLIKKYVLDSFETTSTLHLLHPDQVISYTNNQPQLVVSSLEDKSTSLINIVQRVKFDDRDINRRYASVILCSLFETATFDFFRAKYGLCYASSIGFKRRESLDRKNDIEELTIKIECDHENMIKILNRLPEFYNFLQNYPINDETVRNAKMLIRRYKKCSARRETYFDLGQALSDGEYYNETYFTSKQLKRFEKNREKIEAKFVINLFKQVIKVQPFIFVVTQSEDQIDYDNIVADISKNSQWIENL